jgi:hypothetical protein
MSNVLPANRTSIDLFRTFDTSTNVAAIVEERINLLRVTDLAHVALLVRHLPIGRTLAPSLSILESANVLVPRSLLHKCALTMLLILKPGSFVDIAVLVCHLAFSSGTFASHIWAIVSLAIRRDVSR